MNRKIAEGIVLHSQGLNAEDPITGKVIPPKGQLSDKDREMGEILDHFSLPDLKRLCDEANTEFLYRSLLRRRVIGTLVLVGCIAGVCSCFSLLTNATLNFVPSMFQIGIGLSMMYLVIVSFRVVAAKELNKRGVEVEVVRKWRDHIGAVKKSKSKNKVAGTGSVLQKLREAVAGIRKGSGASVRDGKQVELV